MTPVSAVLFDLGNVLVRINPGAFAETLGVSSREAAEYRPGVIDLTKLYERGELSTNAYFAGLGKLFGDRFPRTLLEEAMARIIVAPVPGMIELLDSVRSSGVTAALVSNTNEFHVGLCLKQFPFLEFPPRRYLSYELRCLKPDPLYYRKVLQDLGVPAGRVLFIDDLTENVEGAQKEGMMTHLFKDAGSLVHELRALGIRC